MKDMGEHLAWAHPLIQTWFKNQWDMPTSPQRLGWPSILAGQSTLISSPTGSGKTLAAFLICLDRFVRKSLQGTLKDQLQVIYVSPLKALSNDVLINLKKPLEEIFALAKKQGLEMQEIRVCVRTSDTQNKERLAFLKKPPHILVTTPESLYILLTAEKSRRLLDQVDTLIIDEIHALANNKRGSHLMLSIERLARLSKNTLLRIGLSATQKPLNEIAKFLVGNQREESKIIDVGNRKDLDLAIETVKTPLSAVASHELWDEIYERIANLATEHRSTLIFVNTRRLAEKVAHHLRERLGEDSVAAHHGSLSRKIRLHAEKRLKEGSLKALVATASLELGIDVGTIDLVCQIGSPRSIATLLQRIGRAGHWYGAISKGRLFATTRDELLECAALIYAIRSNDLDRLIIPESPLDILAQQIVACCSSESWKENELFKLVKLAYPYKNLKRKTFNEVLAILSEGIAGSRGRYGVFLFRDRVNKVIKARRGSRIIAIMNGGAIPDTGLYSVISEPNSNVVGTLDEDFAIDSHRGDIILLGTTAWQIQKIDSSSGRVYVRDAAGAAPTVPFWQGEAPGRTIELSHWVGFIREKLTNFVQNPSKGEHIAWLIEQCCLDSSGAEQLLTYAAAQYSMLGVIPSQKLIVAERFFDEGGGMQLVIHAPFGARINKAWGLALRKKFCRSFNFELQAQATDNGICIALAEQHSFPLADVFQFLNPKTLKDVLTQAVLQSPVFKIRFRWAAMRALAILKYRFGKKMPPQVQRILTDDLLAAVFPDAAACQDNLAGQDIALPHHPLIEEVMKDIFHEALDLEGLTEVLQKIKNENIKIVAKDTITPSVFAHEILNANPYAFLDDAPLEERRSRAVSLRHILPTELLETVGKLDPKAVRQVQEMIWPDIRDADELHDLLQTVIVLPFPIPIQSKTKTKTKKSEWQDFLNDLELKKRVGFAIVNGINYWFSAEKYAVFKTVYPDVKIIKAPAKLPQNRSELSQEEATKHIIRGWLLYLSPCTTEFLCALLRLSQAQIVQGLIALESSGYLLRGHFTNQTYEPIEWCERRILARIHRLTLHHLRKEIEPVTPQQFFNWLLDWQHINPETRVQGKNGLIEVIRQLQGFEIPASAWERAIFAKRISNYDSELLDHLIMTGIVGFGRLAAQQSLADKKRIVASSNTPITFFIRTEMQGLNQIIPDSIFDALSHIALKIYNFLKENGASFFTDITYAVDHLKTEIEFGLWELVAAGLITADSFENIRHLIDPKKRLQKKRKRIRYYPMSRWSLLKRVPTNEEDNLKALCWILLKRYGVVFRDILKRETLPIPWRSLLTMFRRLEEQGEIRSGRFIEGVYGEQFALPYVVHSLRLQKNKSLDASTIEIAASDPLNLVGILLMGPRVSRLSKKKITMPLGTSAKKD